MTSPAETSHLTSAQVRDYEITFSAKPLSVEVLREFKARYAEMKSERASDPDFVECPRCREHHNEKTNYEGVCHRCRLVLLDHFPNHAFTIDMEKHDGWTRGQTA